MDKKQHQTHLKFITIPLLIILLIFSLPFFFSTFIGTKSFALLARQKGKQISVSSMKLRWLGPQLFENISYSDPEADITIGSLRTNLPIWHVLNLKTFAKESLFSPEAKTQIDNAAVTVHIAGYPKAKFEEIELDTKTDIEGKTQLVLQGKTSQDSDSGKLSLVASFDDVKDVLPQPHKTNIKDLSASIKWQFENISTLPLDQILSLYDEKFKGFLYDLLGNKITLGGSLHLTKGEGPLDVSLLSQATQLTIPAYFSPTAITLTGPVKGSFILPQKYGRYNFSYLLKALFSEFIPYNPIAFYISDKGFSLPLTKNALQNIKIQHGVIDLGLGKATEGSLLHDLFQILDVNIFGSSQRVIDTWFSPTHFRLEQSNLYLDRTDMLLDYAYQICFWGRLDLSKEYIDLVAGLTSSALQNAYGIEGLPADYVLQVPIRGSFNHPKIHKTSATKKIIAFKATELAQHPNLPFFGSILKQLMKEDQSNVPPPRRPLPWEHRGIEKRSPTPRQKKTPIDDLFKIFQ